MNAFRCFALAALLVAPAFFTRAAPATDVAAGRALVGRYADAIVGVELVVTLKMKMGDRELAPREHRVSVNGTVISPGGLTVTTLAEVDPQAAFESLRAGAQGGRVPEIVGSEFKEVNLRLADGREVPARFVLKDADLDLAFMAPEISDTGKAFAHVSLADAAEGELLNEYYFVARAPKTLQRVPIVRRTEIMGIVEKPRRVFLLTDQTPGTPVFDPRGKVLGITVQHFANGRRSGLIVLPAADIAEMAQQAEAAHAKAAAEPQP